MIAEGHEPLHVLVFALTQAPRALHNTGRIGEDLRARFRRHRRRFADFIGASTDPYVNRPTLPRTAPTP